MVNTFLQLARAKRMMKIYRVSINQREYAVINGGGLAGLFAARELSGHFERYDPRT
jgi:heterodisulfide reductase subunit A-like polyferredoxin